MEKKSRVVRLFAWFPVKVIVNNHPKWIWLQYYEAYQEYQEVWLWVDPGPPATVHKIKSFDYVTITKTINNPVKNNRCKIINRITP